MKTSFSSRIDLLDKLKLHHVTIPKCELEKTFEETDHSLYNQRFRITINQTVSWLAGSMVLGNETSYISVSKARMKELGVLIGDVVFVELEKEHSEYGMEIPVEFVEALQLDPIAKERFLGLTKGMRRNVIYLVNQFKTEQKRIEKSFFFLDNMKKVPANRITMRTILGKEERE